MVEVDFGPTVDMLKEEYLCIYEGIWSEIVNNTRFDENSDLNTTYLVKSDRFQNDKFKSRRNLSYIRARIYFEKTVRWDRISITFRYRCSKSLMSKSLYMHCKSLHSLPKFASKTQRIQVGNGQFVNVLFIILVIIDVHRHRFEIYMLVLEIHENVDLVL